MVTKNTKLARLIGEVLRLSDEDVKSDERWAGVAELRQLDPEQIFKSPPASALVVSWFSGNSAQTFSNP
jgi:hypothetical protein